MKKEQIVKEMLEELSTLTRDIKALRSRLDSGLTDDKLILTNYKVLMQAIALKDELLVMLSAEIETEITLVKLWQDMQEAN